MKIPSAQDALILEHPGTPTCKFTPELSLPPDDLALSRQISHLILNQISLRRELAKAEETLHYWFEKGSTIISNCMTAQMAMYNEQKELAEYYKEQVLDLETRLSDAEAVTAELTQDIEYAYEACKDDYMKVTEQAAELQTVRSQNMTLQAEVKILRSHRDALQAEALKGNQEDAETIECLKRKLKARQADHAALQRRFNAALQAVANSTSRDHFATLAALDIHSEAGTSASEAGSPVSDNAMAGGLNSSTDLDENSLDGIISKILHSSVSTVGASPVPSPHPAAVTGFSPLRWSEKAEPPVSRQGSACTVPLQMSMPAVASYPVYTAVKHGALAAHTPEDLEDDILLAAFSVY